jgi:hypothetical protein
MTHYTKFGVNFLLQACPNQKIVVGAQLGSRVIVVVVQAGAVKIYVAAVEALKNKERQDETQFTTKTGGKTSFGSQLFCFVKFSFSVIMHFDAQLC